MRLNEVGKKINERRERKKKNSQPSSQVRIKPFNNSKPQKYTNPNNVSHIDKKKSEL
jgi:hypothetical protein